MESTDVLAARSCAVPPYKHAQSQVPGVRRRSLRVSAPNCRPSPGCHQKVMLRAAVGQGARPTQTGGVVNVRCSRLCVVFLAVLAVLCAAMLGGVAAAVSDSPWSQQVPPRGARL